VGLQHIASHSFKEWRDSRLQASYEPVLIQLDVVGVDASQDATSQSYANILSTDCSGCDHGLYRLHKQFAFAGGWDMQR
jgi:hypothetical protein